MEYLSDINILRSECLFKFLVDIFVLGCICVSHGDFADSA